MKKYSVHPFAFSLLSCIGLLSCFSVYADEALNKDMTSLLALLGLLCGQVVSAETKSSNDHTVVCKDGNRYRVFLNPEGRVVATKL